VEVNKHVLHFILTATNRIHPSGQPRYPVHGGHQLPDSQHLLQVFVCCLVADEKRYKVFKITVPVAPLLSCPIHKHPRTPMSLTSTGSISYLTRPPFPRHSLLRMATTSKPYVQSCLPQQRDTPHIWVCRYLKIMLSAYATFTLSLVPVEAASSSLVETLGKYSAFARSSKAHEIRRLQCWRRRLSHKRWHEQEDIPTRLPCFLPLRDHSRRDNQYRPRRSSLLLWWWILSVFPYPVLPIRRCFDLCD
jgi:hypothetical protein